MLKSNAFTLFACATMVASAWAEDLQQPDSIEPVSSTSDYYAQPDTVRSPSDLRIEEPADPAVEQGGKSCDSKGCDDDCGKGCDCCDCSCYLMGPDEPWTLMSRMPENECRRWNLGGWVSAGVHSDQVPLSFNRADLLSFGDFAHFHANQMWLYLEREADGECGWDWGYRADVVYGLDAQKTQSFGNSNNANGNQTGWDTTLDNGIYGWALPQAYVEVANGNLSVKAGHFFTLVGYEVVTAPDNFFYTHSLTMFNSEPFIHTGVLATYQYSENIDIYGGWTQGWDTGFDTFDGSSSWLGGFGWSISDNLTLTYISTAGNLGFRGRNAYTHSIVIDAQLNDRLKYVCQSDYVDIGQGNPNGNRTGLANDQVGLNQYLIYSINDCLGVGARAEWWKSDGVSYYEATFGLNYKPHANVTIRPEYRYDWTPSRNANRAADSFLYPTAVNNVSTFSIDAIVTY